MTISQSSASYPSTFCSFRKPIFFPDFLLENSDFFIGEFQDFLGASAPGNRETRTFFGNPNLFQTAPIALRGGMLKSGESWGRGESRGSGSRHSEILPQPAGRKIPTTDLQKSVRIYSKFTKSFDWKSEYNGNPGSVE